MTLAAELLDVSGELAASLARPAVTMSGLLPGLHRGVPAEAYHFKELGLISNSALEEVRRSPAHYLAWISGNEGKETPALSFGRALHMRTLEPALFAKTYIIAPDFGDRRYKAAKDASAAWYAEHAGATILDSATGHATLGMIEAIAEHPIARPLLEGGDAELTMRWDDGTTGLPAKGRADFYRADLRTGVDVKSAADASLDAFRRSVATLGYHRQEAALPPGLLLPRRGPRALPVRRGREDSALRRRRLRARARGHAARRAPGRSGE